MSLLPEGTSETPSPWRSQETLVAEIKEKAEAVDYARLVGGSSVLILGEDHKNSPIREHLVTHSPQLKAAGHYALCNRSSSLLIINLTI